MDFGLSEEQAELKRSARKMLAAECSTAVVRSVLADERGIPAELYSKMGSLGWNGILVAERFGGLGLGMLDAALLLEEGGWAALPGPYLFFFRNRHAMPVGHPITSTSRKVVAQTGYRRRLWNGRDRRRRRQP